MAVNEQIIAVQLDQASQQRTLRGIEQVERAAREIGDGFEAAARRAQASIRNMEREARSARLEMLENVGERSSAVFSAFDTGGELGNVAGLVGDLAAQATVLGPAAVAGTLAVSGLTVVIGELQRQAEEAKTAAEGYAAAQQDAIDLILSGSTTAEVTARQADIEARRAAVAENQATLQDFAARLEGNRANIARLGQDYIDDAARVEARILQELSAATGGRIDTEAELNAAITLNQTAIDGFSQSVTDLGLVLNSGALAANDAAAQTAHWIANQRQQTDEEIQLQQFLATATSEQVQARLEANWRERDSLNALYDQLEATSDGSRAYIEALDALESQLGDLWEENERLGQSIGRLIAAEQQAAQNDSLLKALEAEGKARQALSEMILKDQTAEEQHRAKMGEIVDEARESRAEEEANAEKDRLKALRDHNKRVQEIIEDADEAQGDAIAERSALEYVRAERAEQKALRREEESYDDRLDVIQEGLDDSLEAIEKNARKALAAEQAAFAKQDAERDKAILQAQVDAANAITAQRLIQQNGQLVALNDTRTYWQTSHDIATEYINRLRAEANIASILAAPPPPSPFPGIGASALAAAANLPTFPRLSELLITPPGGGNRGALGNTVVNGGTTVNVSIPINLDGREITIPSGSRFERRIREVVDNEVYEIMRAARGGRAA